LDAEQQRSYELKYLRDRGCPFAACDRLRELVRRRRREELRWRESWTPVNDGLTTDDIFVLAVDPLDADKVYAGGYGGIFRSTDGGLKWSLVKVLPHPGVWSLFIDPSNTDLLYGTGMEGGKAFKSTDGGARWDDIQFGFPRLGGGGLAVSPAGFSLLFATSQAGFLANRDGGRSWKPYSTNVRVFSWLWQDSRGVEMATDGAALYAASAA
jgi:hypothetical protein